MPVTTPTGQTNPSAATTPAAANTLPAATTPPAATNPPAANTPPAATNAPFVRFQAIFREIPDGFLTLDQVSNVASSLSTAISSYIQPAPVTINITQILPSASSATAAAAATPSRRRSLLQSSQTFQATLTFTLTFTSPQSQIVSSDARETLSADLSSAITQAVAPLTVDTTLTPVTEGTTYSLNASVTFPPGNTVSATPAQGTLAAVTLANALEADAGEALPGLVVKDGPVSASGTSLQVVLVAAGPGSTIRVGSPPPFVNGPPNAGNTNTSVGGKVCAELGLELGSVVWCWLGVIGADLGLESVVLGWVGVSGAQSGCISAELGWGHQCRGGVGRGECSWLGVRYPSVEWGWGQLKWGEVAKQGWCH